VEPVVADYLDALTGRVRDVAGEGLEGLWAVGSLGLGGFDPARSDVDVQAVVEPAIGQDRLRGLATTLDHARLPCPARKLEFVAYRRGAAPRFALNLNTGAGLHTHVGLDPDAEPGFWFAIDVAIARQSAITLAGAPAAALLPEQPPRELAAALAEALDWFEANGTRADLERAAARAWAWASDGVWRSKPDAAAWAAPRDAARGVPDAARAALARVSSG
jgi:hypothetical protein